MMMMISSIVVQMKLMLLLLVLITTTFVNGTLTDPIPNNLIVRQVHMITRHGARTVLPKDSNTLYERIDPILTPLGQKQMYDLGTWIRNRYFIPGKQTTLVYSDGTIISENYNPLIHKFTSSEFARTITSSTSLLLGLFPTVETRTGAGGGDDTTTNYSLLPNNILPHNIPIYTSKSIVNDITIRAYDNCPIYEKTLQNVLYNNPQNTKWKQLDDDNEELLEKIAKTIIPEYSTGGIKKTIKLQDIWNIYDTINVAKTECFLDPTSVGCKENQYDKITNIDLTTALTNEEWEIIQHLTHTIEHDKYSKELASNLLGSNLLWMIFNEIEDTIVKDITPSTPTTSNDPTINKHNSIPPLFHHYSAHYPTLLGIFAALQEEPTNQVIPDYSSAIIIEVSTRTTLGKITPFDVYIKILYYEGDKTKDLIQVPLRTVCSMDHDDSQSPEGEDNNNAAFAPCRLSTILSWFKINLLNSQIEWCKKCNNEHSDICIETQLVELYQEENLSDGTNNSPYGGSNTNTNNNKKQNTTESEYQMLAGPIAAVFFVGMFSGLFLFWCLMGGSGSNKTTTKSNIIMEHSSSIELPTAHAPSETTTSSEPPNLENVVLT